MISRETKVLFSKYMNTLKELKESLHRDTDGKMTMCDATNFTLSIQFYTDREYIRTPEELATELGIEVTSTVNEYPGGVYYAKVSFNINGVDCFTLLDAAAPQEDVDAESEDDAE